MLMGPVDGNMLMDPAHEHMLVSLAQELMGPGHDDMGTRHMSRVRPMGMYEHVVLMGRPLSIMLMGGA